MPWQRVPHRPGRRRNCGRHAPSHGALLNGYTAGVIEHVRYVALGWPGGPNPSPRAGQRGCCRWLRNRRAGLAAAVRPADAVARRDTFPSGIGSVPTTVWCAARASRRVCEAKRMRRAEPARRRSGPTLLTPIALAARQSHLSPITHQRGALGGVGGASGRDLCTSPYQPPLTAPGGETPTALVRR